MKLMPLGLVGGLRIQRKVGLVDHSWLQFVLFKGTQSEF